jgi:hypothetical protein
LFFTALLHPHRSLYFSFLLITFHLINLDFIFTIPFKFFKISFSPSDRLCGLVVLATDPEARVRFPALPDFLKKNTKENW